MQAEERKARGTAILTWATRIIGIRQTDEEREVRHGRDRDSRNLQAAEEMEGRAEEAASEVG